MKEEEVAAAAQEFEMLRTQLDNMAKQEELIQVTLEEYTRAKSALEELKGKKKGEDILVPIGANCWVHATLGDTGKGIASIGSNVAVGQKLDLIIERLDAQLDDIRKAATELSGNITRAEARARDLSAILEQIYGRMDAGQDR